MDYSSRPPEIWNNRPYDSSCDIWSLGCMIYELTCLRPPFLGDDFPSLKRAVISGRYPSIPKKYSVNLGNIIALMLRVNAKERPSAKAFLTHPYIVAKLAHDVPIVITPREQHASLMETIKMPINLHKLNHVLPKPQYPNSRPISPLSRHAPAESKPRSASAPPPAVSNLKALMGENNSLTTNQSEKREERPEDDSMKENHPASNVNANVKFRGIAEAAKADGVSNQENIALIRRYQAALPIPRAPLVARPNNAPPPHRPFQLHHRIW
jgi:NIMA (never in mitosis gene a)-related kinase 1/4/5